MSFTNTRYDECAYKKELFESTSVLNHVIEKNRYILENCGFELTGTDGQDELWEKKH